MSVWGALKGGAAKLIAFGSEHSAVLFTVIGVTSGFGAVYSGIAVTPEVTRMYDNEVAERERFGYPPMTFLEKVQMIVPSYIPTFLLFGTSATCFILNTLKEERKIATLAGLYSMSEKSFEEYREKVKEMFGKNKESKVRDEIAVDHANRVRDRIVYLTGNGDYLCLESWTNTKFRSSQMAIEQARIRIKDRLRDEMHISLEEVLQEMEVPVRTRTDPNTGFEEPLIDRSDIGWTVDDDLTFRYTYTGDDTMEPMMVITFEPPPHPDFNKYW